MKETDAMSVSTFNIHSKAKAQPNRARRLGTPHGEPALVAERPLTVTVIATFPVPASWSRGKREGANAGTVPHLVAPDTDNLLKTIDALNTIVWNDHVDARVIKKCGETPSLKIEVMP
jgi:Holliday junction resolvase RusA-like endonuclease